jgi:TetR/AcrR family transcriptional regulator, transcriptional repressor for nem operon
LDFDAWEKHAETLALLLEKYLTEAHRDNPGAGCAMGALLGDMSRASKSAKTVYTARVKHSLVVTAGLLPSEENANKRGRALLISSSAACWGRSISLGPYRTRAYRAKFSTRSASSSSI